MSIGKRLISTGVSATPSCTTDTTDIFDDGHGIALYSLDYDASTAPDAATDYSGTASNVEFGTDGHINWGARFNGSSSNISFPAILSSAYTGSVSASVWFKTTENSTDIKTIINSSNTFSGTSPKGFALFTESGVLRFVKWNISGTSASNGTTNIIDGDWHNAIIVLDNANGTLKLYLDGETTTPEISFSITANQTYNKIFADTWYLAQQGAISTRYFNGDIDQVRIFNRVLTSDEISTLYAETACVYTGTTQSHLFGCIANYNLDNDAKEAMGVTAYDGTESNITYEFGRFGTAAVFNGSSSKIEINSNLNIANNSFSFSFWIACTDSTDDNYVIITEGNNGNNKNLHIGKISPSYYTNPNKLRFGFYSNDVDSTTNVSTDGTWQHWVCTFDASSTTQKVYLNGNLENTRISSSNFTGTSNLQIGGLTSWGSNNGFNGSIDQVRVFSSALTSSQVEGLFNDEKQAYITKSASDPFGDSSEVAFYKMENNSNDSTGSNNGSDTSMTYSTSDALFDSYSAVFDGSSSIITTSLNKSSYSSLSYSVWIKTSSTSQQRIIDASSGNSQNRQCLFTRFDGSKGIRYISIGDDFYDTGNLNTLLGDWFHVVVTDGGGNDVNLYINGELVTFTKVISNGGYLNPSNTLFGAGRKTTNDIGNYFSGDLDQVRIFNRVLEGDEVFKLYAEVIN